MPLKRSFALVLLLLLGACTPAGYEAGMQVITHPDGRLYVGDRVSFEVIPQDLATEDLRIQVSEGETVIGSSGFGAYGVGGRNEAVLWWIWDTGSLEPGEHRLTFTTLPQGPAWTRVYTLHPASRMPGAGSSWTSTQSVCCTIFYITGSAAERDMDTLSRVVDAQAVDMEHAFAAQFSDPVRIIFLPRTLGHGGFASDSIYVSYLDRNYAGSTTTQVIRHELAHLLDAQLGGGYRPSILVEGLAVYQSGGHFKQEALLPRAAALLPLGWYIPLRDLCDDFYHQQHETGYLQAGALVQFLMETYGQAEFEAFYRNLPDPQGAAPSAVLDTALQVNFGIGLDDLEAEFIARLKDQQTTPDIEQDLRLTVLFYDTVRRYQQTLDPSAYFLTAWLPDGATMREQGIVADFQRHPENWKNWWIETLLTRADRELRQGSYVQAQQTLQEAKRWMDWFTP